MMVLHPDVRHRRRERRQVLVVRVEQSDGLDARVEARELGGVYGSRAVARCVELVRVDIYS